MISETQSTSRALSSVPNLASNRERWTLALSHRERLLRIARRRLANHPEVEDCVHDALIRCMCFEALDERRIGEFLTVTVIRLCIDVRRREVRSSRLQNSKVDAACDSVEDDLCDRSVGRWLMHSASDLSTRERDVILARAEGLSTAQAAVKLGISAKAAEAAFTRARARLLARCSLALQIGRPARATYRA